MDSFNLIKAVVTNFINGQIMVAVNNVFQQLTTIKSISLPTKRRIRILKKKASTPVKRRIRILKNKATSSKDRINPVKNIKTTNSKTNHVRLRIIRGKKLVIRKKSQNTSATLSTNNSTSLPKVVTQKLPKATQKRLNKALYNALKNNKPQKVVKNLLDGGSLAYANFDGLIEAAEKGHLRVFRAMFTSLDSTTFLDKYTIEMCMEEAEDMGHKILHGYLQRQLPFLRTKLSDQNLNGLDDGF